MIKSQLLDKKGISEIMSYVILIIIAMSLSVLVFGYITLYIPKDQPTCGPEISLSIQDFSCFTDEVSSKTNLSITFVNKGKFTIDAVYVRIGKEGREVRDLINDPETRATSESFFLNPSPSQKGLPPEESITRNYDPNIKNTIVTTKGTYDLEIQPAIFDKGELVICQEAVRVQPINCETL